MSLGLTYSKSPLTREDEFIAFLASWSDTPSIFVKETDSVAESCSERDEALDAEALSGVVSAEVLEVELPA